MKLRLRKNRLKANIYFLRKPLRQFAPLFLTLLAVLALGTVAFRFLSTEHIAGQGQDRLSWPESFYAIYSLIFMEHVHDFPRHWLLRVFYFVVPPLGLIVILDGVVTFALRITQRDENSEEWMAAMAQTLENHVVLVGLGKVGFRVLQELLKLGENVVVLEKNADCENLAYARHHGVPTFIGTGREAGILDSLNVAKAKSAILATTDDLANLEIAMDARKANPTIRVVLRMYDQELAEKVHQSFDIHLAFSTSSLAAPTLATSSSDRSIISSFYVGSELLVVAKLFVNPESELAGKTVGDYASHRDIFFLSRARGNESIMHPDDAAQLQPGDRITVQTSPARLRELHKWNRDVEPY
jgi:Trk K+ transport system NAD-binding subunit